MTTKLRAANSNTKDKALKPGSIEMAAYNIIRRDFGMNRIPVHEPSAKQAAISLANLLETLLKRAA